MKMQFKNIENGYVETKSVPWLWALLFGGLYFIVCGIWAPILIQAIIAGFLYSIMGPPATLIMVLVAIIYAAIAPSLVRNSYLRKGWIEITDGDNAQESSTNVSSSASKYRQCPSCAEDVRNEAIKCRFCGEALEPVNSSIVEENKLSNSTSDLIENKSSIFLMKEYGITFADGIYSFNDKKYDTLFQAANAARMAAKCSS
jgi:hypothetical protein